MPRVTAQPRTIDTIAADLTRLWEAIESATLGLSSLGRLESDVLGSVRAVESALSTIATTTTTTTTYAADVAVGEPR